MLTGETPFPSPDPFLVLNSKLHTDPPSLRKIAPEVSAALEEIVLRAMERDPLKRYRDARELSWDLEHQDQVAVGASADRRTSDERLAVQQGSVFPYLLLRLIPVFIFALLLYVAGQR
jgi:serine/threonine protein kinase